MSKDIATRTQKLLTTLFKYSTIRVVSESVVDEYKFTVTRDGYSEFGWIMSNKYTFAFVKDIVLPAIEFYYKTVSKK